MFDLVSALGEDSKGGDKIHFFKNPTKFFLSSAETWLVFSKQNFYYMLNKEREKDKGEQSLECFWGEKLKALKK